MQTFDPVREIQGSELILEANGQWPNFHDADVHSINFWRGDIRPDENVWVPPMIDAHLELTALEKPFLAVLRFHGCDGVEMSGFHHCNQIDDLTFSFQERDSPSDAATPLSQRVRVEFAQGFGVSLRFTCLRVEVRERRDVKPK